MAEALDATWYRGLVVTSHYQGGTSTSSNTLIGRYDGVRLGTLSNESQVMAVAYGYDNAGRISSIDTAYPGVTRHHDYRYLGNSNQWDKVTSSDGFSLERGFESNRNVISSITSTYGATTLTRFDYGVNTAGQRTWSKQSGTAYSDYGDATHWKFTYDSRGEVATARSFLGTDPQSETQPLAGRGLGFTYDTAGNRKSASVDNESVSYTDGAGNLGANALNQIKTRGTLHSRVSGTADSSASISVGGNTASRQGRYFDATAPISFGQYAQVTTTASLSGQNMQDTRAVVQAPATETFTHDDDGNLTDDGRWHYTYDAENRLTSMLSRIDLISGMPDIRVYFTYDYLGRRVRKQYVNNGTTVSDRKFIYDAWNLLAEVETSNGAVARTYVWGLDLTGSLTATGGVGALVMATMYPSGSAAPYQAAQDANGNVLALVAAGGAIAATYEYDPFGQTVRAEENAGVSNPFRFSSKYYDRETGLLYYGHRYYDSSTGRFINRDPIGDAGGANLYAFVGNNGVDRWDYLGNSRFLGDSELGLSHDPDPYMNDFSDLSGLAVDPDTERATEKAQPEAKNKDSASQTGNTESDAQRQRRALAKETADTPAAQETRKPETKDPTQELNQKLDSKKPAVAVDSHGNASQVVAQNGAPNNAGSLTTSSATEVPYQKNSEQLKEAAWEVRHAWANYFFKHPKGAYPLTMKELTTVALADKPEIKSYNWKQMSAWTYFNHAQGFRADGSFHSGAFAADGKTWVTFGDKQFTIIGKTYTGGEINYYGEGMMHAARGESYDVAMDRADTMTWAWNKYKGYGQGRMDHAMMWTSWGYRLYSNDEQSR